MSSSVDENIMCMAGGTLSSLLPGALASSSSSLEIVALVMYRDAVKRETLRRWSLALRRRYAFLRHSDLRAEKYFRQVQLRVYFAAWRWRRWHRLHIEECRQRADAFRHRRPLCVVWGRWQHWIRQRRQQQAGMEELLDITTHSLLAFRWRCWWKWLSRRHLAVAFMQTTSSQLLRARWYAWRLWLLQRRMQDTVALGCLHFAAPGLTTALVVRRRNDIVETTVEWQSAGMHAAACTSLSPAVPLRWLWHWWRLRYFQRRFTYRRLMLERQEELQRRSQIVWRLRRAWDWWTLRCAASRLLQSTERELYQHYFIVWMQWARQVSLCHAMVRTKHTFLVNRVLQHWRGRMRVRVRERTEREQCSFFLTERVMVHLQRDAFQHWKKRCVHRCRWRCLRRTAILARTQLLQHLGFRRLVENSGLGQHGKQGGMDLSRESSDSSRRMQRTGDGAAAVQQLDSTPDTRERSARRQSQHAHTPMIDENATITRPTSTMVEEAEGSTRRAFQSITHLPAHHRLPPRPSGTWATRDRSEHLTPPIPLYSHTATTSRPPLDSSEGPHSAGAGPAAHSPPSAAPHPNETVPQKREDKECQTPLRCDGREDSSARRNSIGVGTTQKVNASTQTNAFGDGGAPPPLGRPTSSSRTSPTSCLDEWIVPTPSSGWDAAVTESARHALEPHRATGSERVDASDPGALGGRCIRGDGLPSHTATADAPSTPFRSRCPSAPIYWVGYHADASPPSIVLASATSSQWAAPSGISSDAAHITVPSILPYPQAQEGLGVNNGSAMPTNVTYTLAPVVYPTPTPHNVADTVRLGGGLHSEPPPGCVDCGTAVPSSLFELGTAPQVVPPLNIATNGSLPSSSQLHMAPISNMASDHFSGVGMNVALFSQPQPQPSRLAASSAPPVPVPSIAGQTTSNAANGNMGSSVVVPALGFITSPAPAPPPSGAQDAPQPIWITPIDSGTYNAGLTTASVGSPMTVPFHDMAASTGSPVASTPRGTAVVGAASQPPPPPSTACPIAANCCTQVPSSTVDPSIHAARAERHSVIPTAAGVGGGRGIQRNAVASVGESGARCVFGPDLMASSEKELKQYGRQLVQEYESMKRLRAGEESEYAALKEELDCFYPDSGSSLPTNSINTSGKTRRDQITARMMLLDQRRVQRAQLRAKVEQLMVSLQARFGASPHACLSRASSEPPFE